MEKSKDEVSKELSFINDEINSTFKRLSDLEELALIKEYIGLINKSEMLMQEKTKKEMELKEKEMLECRHLYVIVPKSEEDKLLSDEVAVYCLKCGLTNSKNYARAHYPALEKMRKINYQTIHNGRLIFDKEITDTNYVQRRYDELKNTMSDEDISKILSEEIQYRIKPSIKNFS